MPHLYEAGLKRQYVRLKYCKALRSSLPIDLPLWEATPAMTINEEGEVAVTKEEVAADALDMYRLEVLSFLCNKVE